VASYVKKVSVWFDCKSDFKANQPIVKNDENRMKKKFVEVIEAEKLPSLMPKNDEMLRRQQHHLCEDNFNLETSTNGNAGIHVNSLEFAPENPSDGQKLVVEKDEGVNGQMVRCPKIEGGALLAAQNETPQRMLTKIKTTKKPQTPEYKRILRRIREKKLARDQNPDVIGQICDSDVLRGQTEIDKVERKRKGGPRLALKKIP